MHDSVDLPRFLLYEMMFVFKHLTCTTSVPVFALENAYKKFTTCKSHLLTIVCIFIYIVMF